MKKFLSALLIVLLLVTIFPADIKAEGTDSEQITVSTDDSDNVFTSGITFDFINENVYKKVIYIRDSNQNEIDRNRVTFTSSDSNVAIAQYDVFIENNQLKYYSTVWSRMPLPDSEGNLADEETTASIEVKVDGQTIGSFIVNVKRKWQMNSTNIDSNGIISTVDLMSNGINVAPGVVRKFHINYPRHFLKWDNLIFISSNPEIATVEMLTNTVNGLASINTNVSAKEGDTTTISVFYNNKLINSFVVTINSLKGRLSSYQPSYTLNKDGYIKDGAQWSDDEKYSYIDLNWIHEDLNTSISPYHVNTNELFFSQTIEDENVLARGVIRYDFINKTAMLYDFNDGSIIRDDLEYVDYTASSDNFYNFDIYVYYGKNTGTTNIKYRFENLELSIPVTVTDTSESNTDTSESNTDTSESNTDTSESNTDTSESNTDTSESNTDTPEPNTDTLEPNTDTGLKNIVQTPSGNVSFRIKDESSILPAGTSMTASVVTDEREIQELTKTIEKGIKDFKNLLIVDINLFNASAEIHQLNDYVSVSIDIPENMSDTGDFTAYLIDDDGNLVKLETTVQNDEIVFKTDHFSRFVIVENANTEVATLNTNTSVKTGDTTSCIWYLISFLASVLCIGSFSVIYKRKNTLDKTKE